MAATQQPGYRVLALVTDAFGGHGGIAQYNRDFLSALAQCSSVGEIIVLPRAGTAVAGTLPSGVRQLPAVKGRIAYSLTALRTAREYRSVDLVFCGHVFMAPLAALVAKLLRAPLWIQMHGIEAWEALSGMHRRALEAADLVTSVSRYTRRRLLEWIGIDPALVKVLPNTVDPRYSPGNKPEYLLERHSVKAEKVLLTVSRLAASERYKGHDRVIRALPSVIAEHADILYLIVGSGDDRARLETLAAECRVSEQVRLVGDVSSEELPDYYRLADVFVMPSTGEGFGIAFLEAIAAGVPVIAGDQDGSRDPLCDGALGILVNPGSCDELASAICTALVNSHSTPMRDRGKRFGFDRFAGQVEMLLHRVPSAKQGLMRPHAGLRSNAFR